MTYDQLVQIALTIVIAVLLYKLYRRSHVKLEDYQILAFVSYTRWKSGRRILKEIKAQYRCSMSYGTFYSRMSRLAEEGYVEYRDTEDDDGRKREFKKLHGGGPPKRPLKIILAKQKPALEGYSC